MTHAAAYDVTERIRSVLALQPDAPALECEGTWTSWGELAAAGERLGAVLAERGIGEGASIAIVMRNATPIVATVMATLARGQCVVTLSHVQPAERLAEDVVAAAPAAVVATESDWSIEGLREAVASAGALGVSMPEAAVVVPPAPDVGERTSPRVAVQMLTSGTTGRPKRIPLSYASLAKSFASAEAYESNGTSPARLRGGVAVIAQPLVHIGGLWMTTMNLISGRRVALLERFAVEPWVARIREHRPQTAGLPPAGLQMLLDADVDPADLSSLKAVVSGAAPVRPELAEAFEERFGAPVLVVYGATEFAGGVAGWTIRDHREWRARKRGSVGRAHRGVELRVVDEETAAPLPAGEVGLLEVRSSQLADKGWVRATDRASLDADGFLYIHGRADAMINRGGFKVDAGAVAATLEDHPEVSEAVVVGMPDQRLGEVPVAAVTPAGIDGDALRAWAKQRLTPYQVPARVVALDELPRTPSSKVSLHLVRELLVESDKKE